MSSGIARIRESKYFPYAIIVYLGYLIVLFILAIPYISDFIPLFSKTEISADELYQSPILPLGIAIFIPLVIAYIVVDYRSIFDLIKRMFIPFKELNRHITAFTTLYLLVQLVFNAIVVVFLVLVEPNLQNFSNYTAESTFLIWLIGCGSSVVIILLDSYIGWKWVKTGLKQPNGLHWVLSYIIYLIAVGITVIIIEIFNPSTKEILLWPIVGIVMVGALSYFIVTSGLFVLGLETVLAPYTTSQSDAWVGLVFMAGIFLIGFSILLLFIHMLTFYSGIFIANWQNRNIRRGNDQSDLV